MSYLRTNSPTHVPKHRLSLTLHPSTRVVSYDHRGFLTRRSPFSLTLQRCASTRSWNVPTESQGPNFSSRGMHIRAFQHAKLMDEDGQTSGSIPKGIPGAYLPWAREYYDLGERFKKPLKEGEGGKPSFRQLTPRIECGLRGYNMQRGRR